MSQALDLFAQRAPVEEGDRARAYNDATGKTVTCQPGGNLSIGIGINLEIGLDSEEIDFLFRHRAGKVETVLQSFAWYQPLSPVRQSVCLDIAYNEGVAGLLHFPHMIAALSAGDWAEAARQCTVADTKLDLSRYSPLRALILSG